MVVFFTNCLCQLVFLTVTSVLPAKLSEGGLFKSWNNSEALGLKLGTGRRNPLLGADRPQKSVSTAKSSLLCTGHREGAAVFIQGTAPAGTKTANRRLLKSGQTQNCKLIPERDYESEQRLWIWPYCSAEKAATRHCPSKDYTSCSPES